jgi:O-antigen/teichoic acid export membrane protein
MQVYARNSSYPRYSVWEALANNAAIQLPVLLIGTLGGAHELGLLMYAMNVIQAPFSLLGAGTAQIYASRAPDYARRGEHFRTMLETTRSLVLIGVLPIVAIGLLSPLLFPIVFGPQWARSGVLVLWMTPWFLCQFLASPTSMTVHIVKRHRLAMAIQCAGLALRTGAVLVAYATSRTWLSESYALSGALFYGLVLIAGFWMAKAHDLSVKTEPANLP